MAVQYLNCGTPASSDHVTAFAPGMPAGYAASDLLVCISYIRGATPTQASTWTTAFTNNSGEHFALISYKWATSGSETAPTITPASGTPGQIQYAYVTAWRGPDPTTPLPTPGTFWTGSVGTDIGPITAATASNAGTGGAVLVYGFFQHSQDDTRPIAALSGDGLTWGEIIDGGASVPDVQYLGHGTYTVASAYDATTAPPLPAGTQAGDLLVVLSYFRASPTPTLTSSWTDHATNNGAATALHVGYKIAVGGDAAPTVTPGGGASNHRHVSVVIAFRNVNQSTPFGTHGTAAQYATGDNIGPIAAATATTTKGAVLVVGGKNHFSGGAIDDFNVLTGDGLTWDEAVDYCSGTGTTSHIVADYAIWTGAAPTLTAKTLTPASSSGTGNSAGVMCLIQPLTNTGITAAANYATWGGTVPTLTTKTFDLSYTGSNEHPCGQQLLIASPQTAAEISYVGAGAVVNAAPDDPITPALPAGTIAGDLLICFHVHRSASVTNSISAGWTLHAYNNDYGVEHIVWYRVATGGDSNPTVTPDGAAITNQQHMACCIAFRGIDQTTPFGTAGTQFYAGPGPLGPIQPITATADNGVVIVMACRAESATGGAASVLSGDGLTWAEAFDGAYTGTNPIAPFVVDYAIWEGGAPTVTAKTFTVTGGTMAYAVGRMYQLNGAAPTGSLISVVGVGTPAVGNHTDTIVPALPAGVQNDDFLLCLAYRQRAGTLTLGSGATGGRTYYSQESLARSSTTVTSYTAKATLQFTPASGDRYLLIWNAVVDDPSGSNVVLANVRLRNTTADVIYTTNSTPSSGTLPRYIGGIAFYTAVNASLQSIAIEYATGTATAEIGIAEARLVAIKLTTDDVTVESLSQTDTTSGTYAAKATLSWTPGTSGDYLIIANAAVSVATISTASQARLHNGTTAFNEESPMVGQLNHWRPYIAMARGINLSGAQSWRIDFAHWGDAGTSSIRSARLIALRLDGFTASYWAEDRAEHSSTSATWADTSASVTDTPNAYAHLVLGAGTFRSGTEASFGGNRLHAGGQPVGSVYSYLDPYADVNFQYRSDWFSFAVRTESAVSTTWKTQYNRNSGAGSSVTDENVVAVIQLGGAEAVVGRTFYVSKAGGASDSNPGTQALPWLTIAKAVASATQAGDTVYVASGTYDEHGLTITASGTASRRIRFISSTKWGALLRPLADVDEYQFPTAWWIFGLHGSYVDLEGFDIAPGAAGIIQTGIDVNGTNNCARSNKLVDINVVSTYVGSAIGVTGYSNVIDGNTILHVGNSTLDHGIYQWGGINTIINNLVVNSTGFGITTWHAVESTFIHNNTCCNCHEGGILVAAGESEVTLTDGIISNNICYGSVTFGIQESSGESVGCLYYNNIGYSNTWGTIYLYTGTQSGTITADPLFVNYQADGSGDYSLQSGSPARNAGYSTYAPDHDIIPYVRSSIPDIGAYEYGATVPWVYVAPTDTGWTQHSIVDTTQNGIPFLLQSWYRVADGTQAAPYISISGGSTSPQTVTGAVITVYRGVNALQPFGTDGADSFNASAANVGAIAAPSNLPSAGAVIPVGIRSAAWTNVAILTGDNLSWSELSDNITNTVGASSFSLAMDFAAWQELPTITAKTFVPTGGTSAPGMGKMFVLNASAGSGVATYTVAANANVVVAALTTAVALLDVSVIQIGAWVSPVAVGGDTDNLAPAMPTGLINGDLLMTFGFIRNDGEFTIGDTDWISHSLVDVFINSNFFYLQTWYCVYDGTQVAPTLTISGGSTSPQTVTLAFIIAARGVNSLQPFGLDGADSFNASAANIGPIAAPAQLPTSGIALVFGERHGTAWSSVATLTGGPTWVELFDSYINSVGGVPIATVLDYAMWSGGAPTITAKTFVPTGGSSGPGFGKMFILNMSAVAQMSDIVSLDAYVATSASQKNATVSLDAQVTTTTSHSVGLDGYLTVQTTPHTIAADLDVSVNPAANAVSTVSFLDVVITPPPVSPGLPTTALQDLSAQATENAWIVLLTLSHADMPFPIRVTSDGVPTTSAGNSYSPFPFEVLLPDDVEGRPPQASLRIDNTTQEIIAELRALVTPPTLTIQIVRSITPDVVEYEWFGLEWSTSAYDKNTITGTLTVKDLSREEFPYITFDSRWRGLFA